MEIKENEITINKTFQYLVPCLSEYGRQFVTKYVNVKKLAFGIKDEYTVNPNKDPWIFILTNKRVNPAKFQDFLNYVKKQEYFVKDYPYDNLHSYKHMIVIKFPESCHKAFHMFLAGKYSKMYTKEQLDKFFYRNIKESVPAHKVWIQSRKVINKNPEIIGDFIKKLQKEFGNNLRLAKSDFKGEDKELEFPVSYELETEVFNYGKTS